jgi:predicted heme/steroid binding protein
MQEFDIAELEKFDGNNGRPVYVAHKGKVYDVSNSKLWKNGLHMKRHHAGNDLTVRYAEKRKHGSCGVRDSPVIGLASGKSPHAQASSAPDDGALSHCVFVFHNDF